MIERRTEPRMLCADLVEVCWQEKSGRNRRTVANLEDISLSGACIQLDERVPLGTKVTITYPNGEYTGVVRYCAFREIGHFVGLEFDEGSKWSQRVYKPLHLLDPRVLASKSEPKAKECSSDSAQLH